MKKTQVALAALALVASTAALANGVTISGNIDAGIARTTTNTGDNSGRIGTNFSGAGGFVAGNNINFSGTEDIGGLKAGFTLGAGFDAGNGSSGNGGSAAMFTQQANVSLSGDFGSIKAGMQLSPFIASVAGTGMLGNGHFFVNRLLSIGGGSESNATNGGSAGAGASTGGFFIPNAISYTTPTFSGFNATVLTTAKSGSEGSVVTDPVATNRYTALAATGSFGDVGVSATYHSRADIFAAWAASAKLPMGDLTLVANYMSVDYKSSNTGDMQGVKVGSMGVGAGYKVSDALNVAVQHARNDIAGGNQSLTGLHAKYNLSSRTFAYASYTKATNGAASQYESRVYATNVNGGGGINASADGAHGGIVGGNNTIAVGVAHSF